MKLSPLSFLLFISFQVAFAGEVKITDPIVAKFKGKIASGDNEKIESAISFLLKGRTEYNKKNGEPVWYPSAYLIINSSGGDIAEAIKIGRLVRKNNIKIDVELGGICYSSCVFIYAGGVKRFSPGTNYVHNSGETNPIFGFNQIGIHRPYFEYSNNTVSVDKSLKNLIKISKEYFMEMNVKPELADDMFSIEPENIRLLSLNELKEYRLGNEDMAFKEKYILWKMKKFGMTREEYTEARHNFLKDINEYCFSGRDSEKVVKKCVSNFEIKYGFVDN